MTTMTKVSVRHWCDRLRILIAWGQMRASAAAPTATAASACLRYTVCNRAATDAKPTLGKASMALSVTGTGAIVVVNVLVVNVLVVDVLVVTVLLLAVVGMVAVLLVALAVVAGLLGVQCCRRSWR